MKKTISLLLTLSIAAGCAAASTGCSLSKPKVDGEYRAELDITPIINSAFESLFSQAGYDVDTDDFEGEVIVSYDLELDDGEYTITVNYDEYVDSYKEYVTDNLIPVLSEFVYDDIAYYGMTEEEYLSYYGYDTVEEYVEAAMLESIDDAIGDIEDEEYEGDYKVRSGIGKAYVELDNGSYLYIEKGDLVAYMDKDMIKDIKDAKDYDDLKDAFEDNGGDESLSDVCDMCESYGIDVDDFVDWLDDSGLMDDGLVYEAQ